MSRLPDSLRSGFGTGNPPSGNGYSDSKYTSSARVDEEKSVRPPPFRSRERRAGQYGAVGGGFTGFTANTPEETWAEETPQVERPTSLERTQAKRRSGNVPYAQRNPRRPTGQSGGDGSRQIEEVIESIKQDWGFMTEEKCIPVQVALQFMDTSSLGLASRYSRFQELHMQLQSALRAIVNEHHQGFNSSIGTFHSIQSALQTSQQRLRALKESLGQANGNLSTTKSELKGLATSSQNYDDMLMILSSIEHLQSIPENLEARISEKRFLSAVELLQDALKSMKKSNMDEIGALSDLRVYLSNQEHSLTDILIEELHNHLYLKSPYSENRWKQHANQHVKGISRDDQSAAIGIGSRQLYQFLDQLDTDTLVRDDPTKNPEADTFAYIQLLIESLNTLGRLDTAVETIAHRLPVELFRVVEKCSSEVDQRYPAGLRGTKAAGDPLDFNNPTSKAVLNDLFGTLYARFEAIAEGHRVVHEVISGISKREGTRGSSSLTGGFRELWKLYQSEIRSLFHDYLANDGDLSYRMRDDDRGGSVFQRNLRDKSKKMFKLTDMDNKSSDLISEREGLESILKTSVPGLVSDSKRTTSLDASNNVPTNDGSATGHKLLVEPSVFNMGILLPPSLIFLDRLKQVVPPSSDIVMSTLTSFLDDFLINVFLPQLDETLVDMCSQSFIEADAFQQDPQWELHAKKPIFKGTVKFFSLIEAFCKMLDNLPHDQAFSRLLITQIVTYYDKCYGWYKALVARTQPHPQSGKRLKLSAALTEADELKIIVDQLMTADVDKRRELIEKEIAIIVAAVDGTTIEDADLMLDRRSIAGMCLLYTSMKWLANKIMQMRFISAQANDSSHHRESEMFDRQRRWTLIAAQKPTNSERVYIPLDEETAAAFDGVHNSYLQLSSLVLRILHVEIRGHLLHFINRSMSRTFQLDQLLNEPDPEVVSLNADLVGFDEELSTHLQPPQQVFITSGLASLIDTVLVTAATNISIMNAAGCGRLQLNILVLQQNLKNVEPNALLLHSTLYFDMFTSGPDSIIAQAKENGKDLGFSYNEMKTLLELCYSEAMASERREVAVTAKRGLEDHVLQLSEFLW